MLNANLLRIASDDLRQAIFDLMNDMSVWTSPLRIILAMVNGREYVAIDSVSFPEVGNERSFDGVRLYPHGVQRRRVSPYYSTGG